MPMPRALGDFADVGLWLSAGVTIFFAVQYTVMARWWRNVFGITIVGLDFCVLAVVVPSVMQLTAQFFGDNIVFADKLWYKIFTVVIIWLIIAFVSTRIIGWELIRRERRLVELHSHRQRPKAGAG